MSRWILKNSLSHHGINGMHWGVKNGPPYPLDKKVSSRIKKGHNERARVSEKEYRDMRSGKIKTNKKDYSGLTHLGGLRSQAMNESKFVEVVKASDVPMKNIAELIGEGYNFSKTVERKGGRANNDDMFAVNLDRFNRFSTHNGSNDPGLFNNCGKCSAAMFLRSKGYDVIAGRAQHGVLNSAAQYWFDGAVPYKEKSIENLERRMSSFGNKGQGTLGCRRADGSGHSLFFQNEKGADGRYRPVIYDGQVRKKYTSLGDLFKAENFDSSQFSTITRLDNATPNWKHLAEDSVVRMSYKNSSMNQVLNRKTGEQFESNNFRFGPAPTEADKMDAFRKMEQFYR